MIKHLSSIFTLVRFPNLVIIAATQYAMRYLIMEPLLPSSDFQLQFGNLQFFLLVLATVFIAGAGYIINDYFDTRTDMINKPARVVVGVEVGRRQAMILHAMLNIIGVGIGIYLSFYIKLPTLSLVFMLATGLLWFYSTTYKRQFLVGNLSVSFLTGLVPMMVVLFEIPLLNRVYGEQMLLHNESFNFIFAWVAGFSLFAFLSTLIRELIKDAEDFEGDSAYGMRTVPIVLGEGWTKAMVLGIIFSTLGVLIFLLVKYILLSVEPADFYSLAYFVVFLIIPFLLLSISVIRAKDKHDYHRASTLIKLIMLFGILYSVLVFILVNFIY